jgi:hypothetical protein
MGGGYLDKMKPRNDDEFISMSQAAGFEGPDHGMFFGGFRFSPSENFNIGATNYFVEDTINIAYTEADFVHSFSDDLAIRMRAQFTHQRSVGDDDLTGSSFDTWVLGGRIALSYRHFTLSLAVTTTDAESEIRSPYGSYRALFR